MTPFKDPRKISLVPTVKIFYLSLIKNTLHLSEIGYAIAYASLIVTYTLLTCISLKCIYTHLDIWKVWDNVVLLSVLLQNYETANFHWRNPVLTTGNSKHIKICMLICSIAESKNQIHNNSLPGSTLSSWYTSVNRASSFLLWFSQFCNSRSPAAQTHLEITGFITTFWTFSGLRCTAMPLTKSLPLSKCSSCR